MRHSLIDWVFVDWPQIKGSTLLMLSAISMNEGSIVGEFDVPELLGLKYCFKDFNSLNQNWCIKRLSGENE